MAKKDIAGLVGGAGLIMSIATKVVKAALKKGAVDNDLHRLTTPEGDEIIKQIVDLLIGHRQQKNPPAVHSTATTHKTFMVVTNGLTGEEWIARLEKKFQVSNQVSKWAKQLLRSKDFVPTNGETHQFGIIFGREFETDAQRTTENIRAEAKRRGWLDPTAEDATLLRELISDEELEQMGLWWLVVMHPPIADSDGSPSLLFLGRSGGGRWLDTNYDNPSNQWNRNNGFVFRLPQVPSEN